MKKHVILITVIIILCTISVLYNIFKIKQTSAATKEITETANYEYTVKDYKGRIAIFKYGKELPLEIFDIYTESLPKIDSARIKEGINIADENELQKIIEEYTG